MFILLLLMLILPFPLLAAEPVPLQVTEVDPVRMESRGNVIFVDFGRDAYGNARIAFPSEPATGEMTVRLGEKLTDQGTIDRRPPGVLFALQDTEAR